MDIPEKNISALREWLQQRIPYCGPLTDSFRTILTWHPTWGNRTEEIKKIRVGRSRVNQSVQVGIQTITSGKFFTISWLACVSEVKKPNLQAALRDAVYNQTHAWKKNNWSRGIACTQCGESKQKLHVDHFPLSFKVLTQRFLMERHDAPDQSTWLYNQRTHGRRLPAGPFVRAWRKFHSTNATYQFLCQHCNCSKKEE